MEVLVYCSRTLSSTHELSGPLFHTTFTSYVNAQLFCTVAQGVTSEFFPAIFSTQLAMTVFVDCACAPPAPLTRRSAAPDATANALQVLFIFSVPFAWQ
ncbi:hypothetical protein E1267_03910 [Nonomuraea longispora]|uniref:Uncharacterized protein n=1 Tax=Nonomuraea longispora TaxID=1848320 RepID=A0A4R4NMT2_9ACTN|nr:hypothetical protein [Nonomuraea longispora]TDC10525.1 hypothetical protein E1267_03910 [Nonomuraea longispora]